MPGRASDLIVIPGSFWERPQVTAALETRDVGRLFALVQQYAGASQTQIAIACGMTQGKVSDIMRGLEAIRSLARFERIANGLQLPDSARITMGLAPRSRSSAIPSRDARPASGVSPVPDLHSIDLGDGEEEEPVRRRTFVSLAGASMVSAILADMPPAHPADSAGQFAPILARYTADDAPSAGEKTPDVTRLTDAVTQARRDYQACRYSGLIKYLPALLAQLHTASMTLDGESRLRAYALAADAHHVAAGLLLKLDDGGLAYLAADRSMQAAQASGDPLTVGASARIITHTLMNGGHLDAAISTASTHAQLLDREISAHTPDSLSVYGSLLLRGAIAAAQHESRSTALDLLAEADDAGRRLGVDGNLRWTAFGPTNARLHRVNIAVTLGDAGTAIDVAHGIDLTKLTVTERKASLFIDTARAFLQWGKHENAYRALRTAEEIAHEEVAGRPSVQRLAVGLARSAPPSLRRDASEFATRLGAQP